MDLAKKITKLGTGTLVANIITLITLPFIAKAYSPFEYGKFTLIFSSCLMKLLLTGEDQVFTYFIHIFDLSKKQ